jgi:RNA binding exosome subunit
MEPLQTQILTLSHKVDALYQLIEQLDSKVAQAFSEFSLANTQVKSHYGEHLGVARYQLQGEMNFHPEMEHKDVLTDGVSLDMNRQAGDNNLTPEVQIQRLTAQLTAAYNRIAALEEQLMKVRIH